MLDAERNRVFESWIDAHKAILFKVARVYGATHSDREDLFQEIALQVWHCVEAFRGDCAATTWIYRVALNTALAWSRKERKHGQGRQDIEAATACSSRLPAAIRGSTGSTSGSRSSTKRTARSRC